MVNPFSPTFGAAPDVLVGRAGVLDEIRDTFDDGPHAPSRTVLFTGARGVGKTVMLGELEDFVRSQGWLVVSEVASRGLLERLTRDHLPRLLAEHSRRPASRATSAGVSTPLGGAEVAWTDRYPAESTLRSQVAELTDALRAHSTGLMITVDEVQSVERDELRKLGEVLQLARREERDLAFAGAGLARAITDLLNDDVVTFLRRAERFDLADVPVAEVADAMNRTITEQGRAIAREDVMRAAEATHGYPFLIQLVGHRIWQHNARAHTISPDDVDAGIAGATRRLGSLVHAPAIANLSDIDRAYLMAMSLDGEGPSRTGEIASRLAVTAQYASVYRERLIGHGLIESAGYGRVQFTIPYLAEYLATHGATEALRAITRGRRADPGSTI